jgi:tRNA threonylcarbamoyladenosine biosynthesis protein TsaE
MGAGKTTLIHALCNELKMEGSFGSPTFSLINEYAAPAGSIYHIDLYRCKNEEEAIRAGVEDCLYSGNRCFVEWPSRAPKIFPADAVHLFINVTGEDARNVEVTFPAGNQSQYKWRTHTKS